MSDPPGPLIASGRTADLYDIGAGKVLRRYREAGGDVEGEARVMELVGRHGFPVPEVFSAGGTDLVMARVDGPTMAGDIGRRPLSLLTHMRRLARLQKRLAEIPAPDWLMAPGWTPDPIGDRVLHLDFHPRNVILAPGGPVVIDWDNAAAGPPGFDAALTYVVMATASITAEVADDAADDAVAGAAAPDRAARDRPTGPFGGSTAGGRDLAWRSAQRLACAAFRRFRGSDHVDAYLAVACDHRLADVHITPDERVAVAALRRRARA